MAVMRKPLQGVLNIIRFNWHFYVIAFVGIATALALLPFLTAPVQVVVYAAILPVIMQVIVSLAISAYVYDFSGLYNLPWLGTYLNTPAKILNVNAGFDETSGIIQAQYPYAQLSVADFYNPAKHTEVSIQRARKALPPWPGTIVIDTNSLPFNDDEFDCTIAIFALHEVRNSTERIKFLQQLGRVTKGPIIITEHLRDGRNFLAYGLGAFHFYSRSSWLSTFSSAGLHVIDETRFTPFISTFVISKHGNSL